MRGVGRTPDSGDHAYRSGLVRGWPGAFSTFNYIDS